MSRNSLKRVPSHSISDFGFRILDLFEMERNRFLTDKSEIRNPKSNDLGLGI